MMKGCCGGMGKGMMKGCCGGMGKGMMKGCCGGMDKGMMKGCCGGMGKGMMKGCCGGMGKGMMKGCCGGMGKGMMKGCCGGMGKGMMKGCCGGIDKGMMKSCAAGMGKGMMKGGCGGMGQGMMKGCGGGMGQGCKMNMSRIRHHFVMRNGIDKAYVENNNPLQNTTDNIKDGKELYVQNCVSCHGVTGLGDGEAGKGLNPKPTNIAMFSKMPMASDGYLYWTVAEGGVPLQTAMPAFKNDLKANDIWKIITYLRQL